MFFPILLCVSCRAVPKDLAARQGEVIAKLPCGGRASAGFLFLAESG